MAEARTLAEDFSRYAGERLTDSMHNIQRCLALLSSEQVWHRPNDVSNSIGNLILHLAGNVRQWILSGIAGQPDTRARPREFAQRDPLPPDEILAGLERTLHEALEVIVGLDAGRLQSRTTIQGYDVTVLSAVFHVVEHFSLHTGQIVYATKLLTGLDLSLYDAQGQRIDGRASGTP